MAKPTDSEDLKQERVRMPGARVFGPFLYIGAVLAVGYWLLDAAIETFVLSHGDFASNVFAPGPDNVWMRLFTGGLFLIVGAVAEVTTKRQARAEKERAVLEAEAAMAGENARLYNETRRLLEELRSLQAARDRFFATVNHELRNAVTAVHGWAEMLIREMGSTPPRTAHEILDSSEYTLGLLDDLLDLSRIDEAKLKLNVVKTSARTVVHDAVQTVRPTADAAGVHVEIQDADSDPSCHTDGTRIRQILVNLLLNAVRHSPRDETVTVEVRGNDSEVMFAVADHGKGIEQQELPTIFDAYTTSDTSSAHGAGLGLTLSRQLARLLGGDIKVESEVGRGTRFVVTVRCWDDEA